METALPVQDVARGPAPRGPGAPDGGGAADPSGRPRRVLVVEPSALTRGLLEGALAAQGFGVEGAGDGATALRLMATGRFDLVIMDTAMHGPPGVPLLAAARSDARIGAIPVIALTDRADRGSVLSAVSLRVSAYLLKSEFKMEALIERVRQTLASVQPPRAAPARERGAGVVHAGAAPPTAGGAPSPGGAAGAGDAAEAIRSVRPLLSRSEMEARLKGCEEVRAFSTSVTRVLKLTSSEGGSMDAVVAAVSQDHAIALKLLKLANSAAYSTGEPVDSVKKAVLRMGLEGVRRAVMSIGVVERYSTAVFTERFNFAHFWEHSIAVGLIAAELARCAEGIEPDNAFAMGLLHDVGRVALIEHMPAEYAQVLEAAARLGLPLEVLEPRMLLVSHAEIMDRLLRAWRFPRDLIDPITLHHAGPGGARGAAAGRAAEIAVLTLADRLAHAMLLGGSGNEVIYPVGDLAAHLKIDGPVLARLEATIPEETARIKLSMLSVGSGENWPQVRERHRSALRAPLRPLVVCPDPARDAVRVFCAALAEPGGDEPPNVLVAHLPDARAAAAAGDLIRPAEERAGAPGLPVVVVSPGGRFAPEPAALRGRAVAALPTPLPIAAFTDAVNRILSA